MSKTICNLERWAMNSNLLLNGEKTKQMLITTPQMSRVHGLGAIVSPSSQKGKT